MGRYVIPNNSGLSLRGGGQGFPLATSCLIPRLLVFTLQLEILVTTLKLIYHLMVFVLCYESNIFMFKVVLSLSCVLHMYSVGLGR